MEDPLDDLVSDPRDDPSADAVGLRFHTDAAVFLGAVGDCLAADPALSTVVATVAAERAAQQAVGVPGDPRDWFVEARAGGVVVGAGMRTAPFAPRPAYLLPMPDRAARSLARLLHERGEALPGVNGALPAVRVVAEETARLTGGRVRELERLVLMELRGPDELLAPAPVGGRARRAAEEDLDLVVEWFEAFSDDADAQAGRAPGEGSHAAADRELLRSRVAAGQVWLWEDPAGVPVHLTAHNEPAYGVGRIGPVYTPPQQRGRGWARACVAEVSRRVLAQGVRACLFADRANPVSTGLYLALGYRPIAETANLRVEAGRSQPR